MEKHIKIVILFLTALCVLNLRLDELFQLTFPTKPLALIKDNNQLLRKSKSCMINRFRHFSNVAWLNFHRIIGDCIFENNVTLPELIRIADKIFLPLRPQRKDQHSCVFLTLGIGNEIDTELLIKRRFYPNCKFYGADPVEEIGKIYRKEIGAFYKTAIDLVGAIRPLFFTGN